jgi:hypothetical protein
LDVGVRSFLKICVEITQNDPVETKAEKR